MKAHTAETQATITPQRALEILKEGNGRFVQNIKLNRNLLQQVNETRTGQWPFATILSCIDSRTSAELIFDQGLGDIFSVRIAGNFVNDDILGSMEFSCSVAGSKLLVVLGHTKCGALKGGLDAAKVDGLGLKHLTQLVHKFDTAIRYEIKPGEERSSSNEDLLNRITYKHVYLTINEIREKSPALATMEKEGKILIVGGVYDLESGEVFFLES